MKIVIAGGSGQLGSILARHWVGHGHEVVVLSRTPPQGQGAWRHCAWDGVTLGEAAGRPGPWVSELDGADVVVNLAGRSVNCRYTPANLAAMRSSRVDSTNAVGRAIALAGRPPRLWLQMSTATLYAHRVPA